MKAEEVMIGDWVFLRDGSQRMVKVSKIMPPYIEAEGVDGQIHESMLGSIWIVAERLLANGFVKKGVVRYGIYGDGYELELREFMDGCWYCEHRTNEFNLPDECKFVGFIHELQQFMRTIHIDKEIILPLNK